MFVVYFHLHYCIARLHSCINTTNNFAYIKSPSRICKFDNKFDNFQKSIAPDKLFTTAVFIEPSYYGTLWGQIYPI